MSLPLRSLCGIPVGLATVGLLLACVTAPGDAEVCEGFPDWQTSPYLLPYPVGAKHLVDQGNCSTAGNGHRGVNRYGYDFLMPIGTPITVARAGTVDLYGHFTHDGADVIVGQLLAAGAALGRSGNTGNTANKPHLHFSRHSCDPVTRGSSECPTLPVTFSNTAANPKGLIRGRTYDAH